MLILHQLHQVDDDQVEAFDAVLRERVIPTGDESAALFWAAHATADSFGGTEVATMTAFRSTGALQAARQGALGAAASELAPLRRSVANRLCTFMTFSPLREELQAAWPSGAAEVGGDGLLYLHDFVTPQTGRYDDYDEGMNTAYREMLKLEQGPSSKVWAALQVLSSGGVARECVIIGRVKDVGRFSKAITVGIPESLPGPLGEWMRLAKTLRDTWTSRLVVAPSWSPTQ